MFYRAFLPLMQTGFRRFFFLPLHFWPENLQQFKPLDDSQFSEIKELAFPPDGKWLAGLTTTNLKLWDVKTRHLLFNELISKAWVSWLSFSIDGIQVALKKNGCNEI